MFQGFSSLHGAFSKIIQAFHPSKEAFMSILGLLILIADIYGIIQIVQSKAKDMKKVLWIVLIILLPIIGLILWYFMGPKK
jgi:uncharacterized membrane protein YhaH (DUF805 family)